MIAYPLRTIAVTHLSKIANPYYLQGKTLFLHSPLFPWLSLLFPFSPSFTLRHSHSIFSFLSLGKSCNSWEEEIYLSSSQIPNSVGLEEFILLNSLRSCTPLTRTRVRLFILHPEVSLLGQPCCKSTTVPLSSPTCWRNS
jgi:hypothetical protein